MLSTLQEKILPTRQRLVSHEVYKYLNNAEAICIFMQSHVFAVWDFMSQVKALQQKLTCTTVPWMPTGTASTRFLINEIVVGEESDVDPDGGHISHFELYLRAMQQAGASTASIDALIGSLKAGLSWQEALQHALVPEHARQFTHTSLSFATEASAGVLAAVFTFGREDLIPDMFMAMLGELPAEDQARLATFKYYLERHIEVDGDHHSHLALAMTQELLGTEEAAWQQATAAVITSLESRIKLWDGVLETLKVRELA